MVDSAIFRWGMLASVVSSLITHLYASFISCLSLFWQEVRGTSQDPESDIVQACRRVSICSSCGFTSDLGGTFKQHFAISKVSLQMLSFSFCSC